MVAADRTKVPQTLLLADDSVTIQRVIELTFADEDIKVVAVSDGDQAIAKLDAAPPDIDIVLADIGMSGKNGYEVAEYVKRSPRLAHIPVVLLTGAFEPVDQAKADAAGCDGVLAKPFEPQLVIGRVKELLARPGPPAASPDAKLAPPPVPAKQAWAKSLVDPHVATGNVSAAGAAKVDEYFDRLDAAFSGLSKGSSPEPPKASASISKTPDELDWFRSQLNSAPSGIREKGDLSMPPAPSSAPPDLPLSYGSARADFNRDTAPRAQPPSPASERVPAMPAPPVVSAPAARVPPPASVPSPAPVAASAAPPPALPPLADAFAALLAAEQSVPAPSGPSAWPSARVEGAAATEDLIEQVTRRVLDRLSDRVVREKAAEVVSAIAERLVREEIERIKASVK